MGKKTAKTARPGQTPLTPTTLLRRRDFKRGAVSGRWYWQPFGRVEIEFSARGKPRVYLVCILSQDRTALPEIASAERLASLLAALELPESSA